MSDEKCNIGQQLEEIGKWMHINGESVYGTTKCLVSHEGPTNLSMKGSGERERNGFQGDFTPEDFWFSSKDNCIYVTSLKWPENEKILIKSILQLKENDEKEIKDVQMLGCKKKIDWELGEDGLHVLMPDCKPNINGYVLKILR